MFVFLNKKRKKGNIIFQKRNKSTNKKKLGSEKENFHFLFNDKEDEVENGVSQRGFFDLLNGWGNVNDLFNFSGKLTTRFLQKIGFFFSFRELQCLIYQNFLMENPKTSTNSNKNSSKTQAEVTN